MRSTALSTIGLSKSYRIAPTGPRPNRITDAVFEGVRKGLSRATYTEFRALSDVTIDVQWGEAVGIIGRNGAGKSTLLKLLTRVSAPTSGIIDLGGRIGSLLEVGTGFHPELTGRENIFLNGTLLGMRRREILRKFDEIVEFSGVSSFLDTPVKRYSSGMYVRLAFSVAAHLETEILAIDEVLAVGDAEFQAKSLAKMRDVAKEGRTVLYVSHQPQTVTALCSSAILLEEGRVSYMGNVDETMSRYRSSFESYRAAQVSASARAGTGELRFTRVAMHSASVDPAEVKLIQFETTANPSMVGKYFVSCHITDMDGSVVVQCDSRLSGTWFNPRIPTRGELRIATPWLKPGQYSVDMFLCQAGILDSWEAADTFDVVPQLPYPSFASAEATAHGSVLADFSYEVLA